MSPFHKRGAAEATYNEGRTVEVDSKEQLILHDSGTD
jgi:hypothetical protein